MTRLTAATKAVPTLEEFKLYNVHLVSAEVQKPSEFGTSIKLVYSVDDQDLEEAGDGEVWDFINFADKAGNAKLGKSPSGGVSRFRAFANSVGGRPEGAEVSGFDDERLEIDWPDGSTFRIREGTPLRIAGELRDRPNGDGQIYRVIKYRGALVADSAA
jgi:hypothetical protein